MFCKLEVSSVLAVLKATETFFLAYTLCVPSQCRQKLSKILHFGKFSDFVELFQKKHLKMGPVSMLKIVCSSVLLAAVLTPLCSAGFSRGILKWRGFLEFLHRCLVLQVALVLSVRNRGLIHQCHCLYLPLLDKYW